MKPEWLEAFELDNKAGPAAPLASDEAKALASKVVDRALSTGGAGLHLRSWHMLLAVAGVGGALTVLGLVYGVGSKAPCLDGPCADRAAAAEPAVSVIGSPVEIGAPASIEPTPIEAVPVEAVPVTALPSVEVAPPSSARRPAKASEPGPQPATPSDLLAEANRARGDREWARAAALYERVMMSQVDESYAATVALASLRLEHLGDPRGALALYERALSARPGGALSAQAEAGAARCRRVLGNEGRSPR